MDSFDGFRLVGNRRHATKVAVYESWKERPPLLTKEQACETIAREFGISTSTVRRYVEEIGKFGYAPRAKASQGRGLYAWDREAVDYFKAFILAATREVGSCTVRNAYRQTKQKALEAGWRVGSEPSAYVHARDINPALMRYVTGGNRALDNMFYIARDLSKLRPFQMIVGDQHRFDFWVSGPDGQYYRPECYLWLDMRTRLVYGIACDRNYNTRTVLNALRMGVQRYGKFENTYNDNGSSEKSALASHIIDQLLLYGMKFLDESEAYRTGDNTYALETPAGEVVDIVPSREEWRKKHRRVFAGVKNAKAKPIERFFSTLEQILRDLCLPGYIREMGMSAAEEEEASRRLAWQKEHGYILSPEEFVAQVMKAIDIYHRRSHGTLKRSPLEELEVAVIDQGFQVKKIDERDVKYIFLESSQARVRGDRVQLMGRYFVGPNLTTEMLRENRGNLVALDGKMVELRYDPDDVENGGGIWAIDPRDGRSIHLTQVATIDPLDEDAVQKAIERKRGNMHPVRSAFRTLVSVALPGPVLSDPERYRELADSAEVTERAALAAAPESVTPEGATYSDSEFEAEVAARISAEPMSKPKLKIAYRSPRDRYEAILHAILSGDRISEDDVTFTRQYEAALSIEESQYWETFIRYHKGETK